MNWHRVADVLLRRTDGEETDERSIKAKKIAGMSAELDGLETEVRQTNVAIHDMSKQARLGSYSRVSIGPRR